MSMCLVSRFIFLSPGDSLIQVFQATPAARAAAHEQLTSCATNTTMRYHLEKCLDSLTNCIVLPNKYLENQ